MGGGGGQAEQHKALFDWKKDPRWGSEVGELLAGLLHACAVLSGLPVLSRVA